MKNTPSVGVGTILPDAQAVKSQNTTPAKKSAPKRKVSKLAASSQGSAKKKPVTVNPPESYKADIEVPAMETSFGRLVHVNLDTKEFLQVREIARDCGMCMKALIQAVAINGAMPCQKKHRGGKLRFRYKEQTEAGSFILGSDNPKSLQRLERAAKFSEQTTGTLSLLDRDLQALVRRIEAVEL
jgi:hypothetical protein